MNDETQPGNRSVETAEFAAASEFAAESHFSDESEFEETSSFSAGSVHFTTGFPAVRDFSLDSGVLPAEPEPESEHATEPSAAAEPEAGGDAATEAETASWPEWPGDVSGLEPESVPETRPQPILEADAGAVAGLSDPETRAEPEPEPAVEPAVESAVEPAVEPAAEADEPAVTVEVPGRPTAQHPVRTTGELSVLRTPEPPAGIDARPPESLWAYDNYPVAEHMPVADDQAGIVSLGYIGAAIMRKKKVWVLTTVLGILLAGGLYRTYHETYGNTTTVLLALDPSLDPTTAIQTDAILAADSTVAQLTMRKLGVQETIPAFEKTYTVTVSTTSNNLLTFTATGPSANAAYNEANTLANTFLQYRAQTELDKESANTAGQAQQVTQTQQTINSINSQIRHLKDEGATTGDSRLTRLQNQLTSAQNLLASLQQAVASSEASQRSATAGLIADSRVIDTGIPAAGHSKKKFALEYGGAAIFGGLVIGLLIVAIGAVISDRLRRRDDVAAALGAPVRVSVTSGGRKRSGHGRREADLNRVAAHLRSSVPASSEGAGSLVVVAVDDKKFVSEAIRQVAVTAAHEGKRVVVADLAGGALGEVLGSREPGIRPVDAGGVRVVLVTPDRGELAPVGPLHAPTLGTPMNGVPNVHAAADLFITLATVNPATGGAHLKTWADDAVAVVTAGESSVSKVQAVGEMIRFAGARLTSAVLLGADENDESLGYATV